jgi:hypothetical protein
VDKTRDTTADWKLYKQGTEYNHSLSPDYYATVNRNWRVFNNNHWNGVNTNGLPVFILPLSQRIIRHFIASVMTNSVKAQYTVENISDTTNDAAEQERLQTAAYLSQNSKDRWEKLKMDSVIRSLLYDGAMSGDMCLHTYWDSSIDTGQIGGMQPVLDKDENPTFDEYGNPIYAPVPIMGEFMTEAVDGVNVMFGNPNDPRVNVNGKPHQPYIILAGREVVAKLRREAKRYRQENKLTDEEIKNLIVPDTENQEQAGERGSKELENGDSEYGKATYLIKYWVDDDGRILFNKSVKNCFIRKDVDTELSLYPVAWANWDSIKNSYHGQAVMTGLVNNQLEIDKAFAKLFKWLGDMAFPKIAYNKNIIKGVTNKIGEVIPVDANENQALSNVIYPIPPTQISNMVIQIIQLAITQTMQLLGVSDAALGNGNPENTSAIIALAKNSAVPLENVRANLDQLIEDDQYIKLDFMLKKFKVPRRMAVDNDGVRQMVEFDPAKAQKAKFRIKVDVGASSYWSEYSRVSTMEGLLKAAVVDAVQFLKRMPDELVPEKEQLISELEKKLEIQRGMQTEQYKMQVIQEFLQQANGAQSGQPAPQ